MTLKTLRPLWRFIEARPGLLAVRQEWQTQLGDVFPSIEPLLAPTGRVATSYPAPNGGVVPLRVVHHANGEVAAVCPEGSGVRLSLKTTDLALLTLNDRAIRQIVCAALGLKGSLVVPRGSEVAMPIGTWNPKPAASFPVVLVRTAEAIRAGDPLRVIAGQASVPTLILTPTKRFWPADLDGDCRAKKCQLVPLDEVCGYDGAFRATPQWESYLEAFRDSAGLRLRPNFTNKPPRKRAERAVKIEKLRDELIAHIKSARDHACSFDDAGKEPELLPRPQKKELAKRAGVKLHDVSRCFNDEAALRRLWEIAGDLEATMSFRGK